MKNFIASCVVAAVLCAGALSPVVAQKPQTKPVPRAARSAKRVQQAAPRPHTPPDRLGREVLARADKATGRKILVSTEDRYLWLIDGRDTLMAVPVAIGMGKTFEYNGKAFLFETPRGKRTVLSKAENPEWNVPDWHYMERASQMNYTVVEMDPAKKYLLKDGTFILTIGKNVGRLNNSGRFWPFDPGLEVMYDSTVFVPPKGTNQRLVPNALGPYKLDTGDGYLIHGTHIYNEDSIGDAVSHGCVRLKNEDLEKLYGIVPVGTPVYIF